MANREFSKWPAAVPTEDTVAILQRVRPFESVKATDVDSTKVANLRRFFNSTENLRDVAASVAKLQHR